MIKGNFFDWLLLTYREDTEALDYCPTRVYEAQDCQGVLDKRTKASAH